jgi:GxxExxY protein
MEINQITQEIIGCAIEVHRHLGPGLLESAYSQCLVDELKTKGLIVETQKPIPIIYKERHLDYGYRLDVLVENTVIIELKTVELLNPVHEAQILTYMKFSGKKIGLLINFNVKMMREGIRRYRL